MKSITSKIAMIIISLLVISFAAISAVSYYTAESKVVELVSQTQDQILSDIKATTDSFFEDYLEVAKKSASDIAQTPNNDDSYMERTKIQKENVSHLVSNIFYGRESDGHFFQSDGTRTTPADNYDPRTRVLYTSL